MLNDTAARYRIFSVLLFLYLRLSYSVGQKYGNAERMCGFSVEHTK